MSKHAPTFVFMAVIAAILIFCGVSGFVGGLAWVGFLLALGLALVSSLGPSRFATVSSRRTHPPFGSPR
jgi:uncharacterized membrane protein YtjA (UPF0391 family)